MHVPNTELSVCIFKTYIFLVISNYLQEILDLPDKVQHVNNI